jgi:hypothetical protein
MTRKIMSIAMAIIMSLLMCACGTSDVTDQVANVVQAEDEHVIGVKEATPTAYPGKTYGEAFENFFGSPTWKYFVGTKEGPDEDGDGEPDYTEDNLDIVEFTGYCTYRDTEVKALIQFTLDMEEGTFIATYLSFNDVPQTTFMLNALLDAVFTDVDMDDTTTSTVETPSDNNENQGYYEDVDDVDHEDDDIYYEGISIYELIEYSMADIVYMFGGGYNSANDGCIDYGYISFYMKDEYTIDDIWIWDLERFNFFGLDLTSNNSDGVIYSDDIVDLLGPNYEDKNLNSGYYMSYDFGSYKLLFGVNKFSMVSEARIIPN